ncbi:MAG: ATPase AAA [Candidatus Synechococcus spongiarum 142]|uniref:DNA 3'-5' helicase n=1 Tax=Candidatus Synechococcus spongiarum 142 TaxID=1608213 RepID=A0A6N3X9S3_9SYNE|nr:MAG: ATPase AAA [Candidatus Synechococcus spongiarum 142]
MSILDHLNSSQQQATAHHCGPLLVVAGAGSGKTRVLTHRIAHLLGHHGVDPEAILAVTFTNKAAREMKERLELLLAQQRALDSHGQPWNTLTEPQQRQLRSRVYHEVTKLLWIGTFHALFARLLRIEMDHYQDPEGFTWTRQFTIYDEQDVRSLLKEIVTQELNLDSRSFDPKQVRWAISRAKNNGLLPDAYAAAHQSRRSRKIVEAYRCYRRALAANNALDFDDLLLIPVQLLRDNDQVRQRWHQRFQHLLVDEYQDTNRTQYELLRLLTTNGTAPRPGNQPWQDRSLFVVGDADQSIYSFRAADFTILMDFQRDFGDGQVDADTRTMIKLEKNYRSTATILEAANALIANNHERIEKMLHPTRDRGRPIQLSCCDDELAEADALVQTILVAKQRNPRLRWGEIAVLYRVNAQSRVLEEALVRSSVPYTIVGGLRFYDRREIKDTLAYLRLLLNPADNVSLLRVINVPRRGIGKTTLQRLTDAATQLAVPLWEIISEPASVQTLAGRSARSVLQFVELINTLQQQVQQAPPAEVVQRVIEDSGLVAQLKAEGTDEAEERLRNLGELVNAALQYQAETDAPELRDFLTSAALASEDKDGKDLKMDRVVLMTFHASKGLEFPVVALVGLEQGLFPNHRAMEDPAALEEERRLCYVGLTRAKDELHLFHARARRLWGGGREPAPPSCFLAELPEQVVEIQRARSSGVALRRQVYPDKLLRSDRPEGKPKHPHDTGETTQTAWRAGDVLEHEQWGQGQVTHCFGAGSKMFLAVKFGRESPKVLDPRLAPIRRISTAG